GRYLIPYLNPGNYLGLDKNELLVQRGMRYEIPAQILKEKKPEFVISNCFEFERFSRPATYSMAQSLFTHLNEGDVRVCLEKLYRWAEPGHTLFASFDPSCRRRNPRDSHSSLKFYYSVDHLSTVGEASGWQTDYVGDWGHPRGLMLMRFRK
ncbi:MAG: hypothetical protein KDD62_03125, partial [Bdellovibrionales bacterium]|nr:hypothetical protein [Bdellovibrionales bacterium]